ncbi:MAG TPA: transketolase, partial [Gammaproteobacteria bacterium]|nr:transketolase [Gammaproteobacteria bacterium]
ELAAEFERRIAGKRVDGWEAKADTYIAEVNAKAETIASRKASQNAIAGMFPFTPEFMGGSADLAGSNLTFVGDSVAMRHDIADANYINYGVREFAMTAIINGISVHGGFVAYGGTFLIFSDYARNALRMAALMKIQNIEVYTHDSIGLGEDGPTHQPVEQTATLRMMPNMTVWRPCDAVESAVCWKEAIKNTTGPCSLIFSRQNLNHQVRSNEQIKNIEKGGYILRDCNGTPEAIIIATGSEVSLATAAAEALSGKNIRVVSMPCTSVFDAQDDAYRESVLPSAVRARVAVEAGVSGFWQKYVGFDGKVVGIDRFGESAPASDLFEEFGFTVDNVVSTVESVL